MDLYITMKTQSDKLTAKQTLAINEYFHVKADQLDAQMREKLVACLDIANLPFSVIQSIMAHDSPSIKDTKAFIRMVQSNNDYVLLKQLCD